MRKDQVQVVRRKLVDYWNNEYGHRIHLNNTVELSFRDLNLKHPDFAAWVGKSDIWNAGGRDKHEVVTSEVQADAVG